MEMRSEPRPAWGSGNSTTWEEYFDIALLVANCFVLLITSLVGIAANLFVAWAVYHQKSLRTWNNALLVNLAVVDIFRCAVDCPILLTIVMNVRHRGHVDELICDAQVASFSFSCCIQLLTLTCISAERYQAIAYPFKTSQRRRRIIVLIPLTWTLAILVAILCLTFVKDSPVYVECQGSQWETIPSYDTFGLYILVPLWTTCFIVIIAFYARIFTIVRAHSRKIFDKGTFALSKKDKTKSSDEQKKEDAIGEEKGHGQSDQNQTQRETVAQVEQGTQAETNSSNKDSTAALLDSTQEPQSVLSGSEKEKQFEAAVTIAEFGKKKPHPLAMQNEPNSSIKDTTDGFRNSLTEPQRISKKLDSKNDLEAKVQSDDAPSEMKQPSLHVMQVKRKSSNGDTTTRTSTSEPQRVLNNLDNKSWSKATVQTNEAPSKIELPKHQAMQVKPKSSNGDMTTGLKSSTTEPPRVPTKLGNKRQSIAKVQIDEAPTEVEQTSPHVSSAPQLDNPEAHSILLVDLEQDKCNNEGEKLSVAKADQVSSSPQMANNVPETEATEVDGAVCIMPSFANKERSSNKKESKMAKRSGYIILTFLLFWLPLLATILVNFLVNKNISGGAGMWIIRDVEILSVSFACMTSLSDPIIYAAVNPQFRTEFYKIRNRFKSLWNKK